MIIRRTNWYLVLIIVTLWLPSSNALPTPNKGQENEDDDVCEDDYDKPFCASNLVTYSNLCKFQKDLFENPKITIVRDGVCECEPDDHYEWNPLCGSDNQTYANVCEYVKEKERNSNLSVQALGFCKSTLKRKTVTKAELKKLKKWQPFMPKYLYEELSSRDVAQETDKNKNKEEPKKSDDKKKQSR